MGIPEEDKGPAWLRGYGENSGHLATDNRWGYQAESGAFAADLKGLKDFGAKLYNELQLDYVPHVKTAAEDMRAQPAVLPQRFYELTDVVKHQAEKLQQVLTELNNHYVAVQALAGFATGIADKYGNTDALASTRVIDVEKGLAPAPVTNTNGNPPTNPLATVTTTAPPAEGYES
jgi:hypothetical protein